MQAIEETYQEALAKQLVAIVEDDPFMTDLVKEMLVSEGTEVEAFPSAQALLSSPNLHKLKTIVLDISLPDIDGFGVMDKLAEDFLGMPVLLISGHDFSVISAANLYGKRIGLKMHQPLSKPFTKQDLLGSLGI